MVKLHVPSNYASLAEAPILATLPSSYRKNLEFSVYHHRDEPVDNMTGSMHSARSSKRKRVLVSAKVNNIHYSNVGQVEEEADSAPLCNYLVGVLSEDAKTLVLRQAPPVVDIRTSVDILNVMDEDKNMGERLIGDKNMLARNQLGEAFGSKKRKTQIKQIEQNKVDMDSVEKVADALNRTIEHTMANRITKEEMEDLTNSERPIPPFNLKATTPAQVYNVDDIMPKGEVKLISVKDLIDAKARTDLKRSVDKIYHSAWALERIYTSMQQKKDHKHLKKLVYALYLMRFYSLKEFHIQKVFDAEDPSSNESEEKDLKAFGYAPKPIIEGFVSRFCEIVTVDGRKIYKFPTKLKDKCLAYLLALILILDDFRVDPSLLAKDLNQSMTKVSSILRELGCKVEQVKKADVAVGAPQKYAVLTVPLSFPKRTR